MRTNIYIQVKVQIDHPEDIDPTDVINEADYGFKSTTRNATIWNTEIIGAYTSPLTE